ncbi:MAG TPA: hypothetical protein VKR58_12560, partial [Aquella sp.]|nr:hypothetical protein [Aquella sp.]
MRILNAMGRWILESKQNEAARIDEPVLFSAIMLAVFGIIMVYSASIAFATHDASLQNSYYYVIRHVMYLMVGTIAG